MYGYVKHLTWGAALLGLVLLGPIPSPAQGANIPTLVSTSGSGPVTFTYNAELFSDQRVENDDFFVIYDFAGFLGFGSIPAGWSAAAVLGPTLIGGAPPPPIFGTDDPAVPNLVFTRNGVPLPPPAPGVNESLGLFSAISEFGGTAVDSSGAQAHENPGDGPVVNFAPVEVPSAAEVTPAPATLVMLGIALPLLGGIPLFRRMRRRETAPASAP